MSLTYGQYGGRFVPETLIPALDALEAGWRKALDDPGFRGELAELGRTYAGRPFEMDRHLARMERTASRIDLALPPRDVIIRELQRTLEALVVDSILTGLQLPQ